MSLVSVLDVSRVVGDVLVQADGGGVHRILPRHAVDVAAKLLTAAVATADHRVKQSERAVALAQEALTNARNDRAAVGDAIARLRDGYR